MKKYIRRFLAFFGLKVSFLSSLKKDEREDPFLMQKKLMGDSGKKLTVFDVGAYIGNVAIWYKDLFPQATIYCFEPFPDSFEQLRTKTEPFKNIQIFNYGVGDHVGKSKFHANKFAPTNSILPTHEQGSATWETDRLDTQKVVEIELVTLDHFIEKNNIQHIDLLKIDVQGAEYMVLKGAENSLKKGLVNVIYTEIMTMPTYAGQKQLDEVIALLRSYGYELFNLYNLSMTEKGQLRQVDGIFVKAKR